MARRYKRLRYEDRRTIEKMLKAGDSIVEIAAADIYSRRSAGDTLSPERQRKRGKHNGTHKGSTDRGIIKRFGVYQRNSELLKRDRQHGGAVLGG